jgi:hypothetical protein
MKQFSKRVLVCSLAVILIVLFGHPSGVRANAGLTTNPSSVNFGSVAVNTFSSVAFVTLGNAGKQNVTILQTASSLPEFILSGPSLPYTLPAGGSVTFQVVFLPDSANNFSGNLAFSLNRTSGGLKTIPVSGQGSGGSPAAASSSATYLLYANTNSLAFGNVLAGSSSSQVLTLSNTGNSAVSIAQLSTVGTGFSASSLVLPATLPVGQSISLGITFAPTVMGSAIGTISVVSNATNSPTAIALSGTGVQPQISVVPASVSYGSVSVGVTNTQTVTVTNPGNANLNVSQVSAVGNGFTTSGLNLPVSIPPGRSAAFTAAFTPAVAGAATGSLSLVSDAPNSLTTVALSGSGTASTLLLSANPASLSFGSVTLGSNATNSVTISNTGNSSVSISQMSSSGAGFSVSGLGIPITLAAGQSASFSVAFAPAVSGSSTGSVSVISTASNSPAAISLSGSGVQPVSHSVLLSWLPSTSAVMGYNIYRGTQTGVSV